MVHLSLNTAHSALTRREQLHLHALLVEAMLAAKLEIIVPLLDEPFADEALLVLYDTAIIHFVLLHLHLEVHLLDV